MYSLFTITLSKRSLGFPSEMTKAKVGYTRGTSYICYRSLNSTFVFLSFPKEIPSRERKHKVSKALIFFIKGF